MNTFKFQLALSNITVEVQGNTIKGTVDGSVNTKHNRRRFRERNDLKVPHSSTTVVPTKSDSVVIFCLQLLSKTLTCTPHLC